MSSDPVRHPSQSFVESTHLVLPSDTNAVGGTFGGRIMQWMDIAAGISAGRHCGRPALTVAVDELHFARPIHLGDVVVVRAQVNHAGKSSMEVGVEVEREHAGSLVREHCLSGYFIFVAVDDQGRPMNVPPMEPQTEEEKRRFEDALRRRSRRLSSRSKA
ncbi:MAG: hypothetical protein A2289_10370 [Deltaproteobacteria bacterium RIFOXYA12_FULL_58_15]|nr:MAG: hypothetical protein A2289_10370 [Deltaproteobacteria bacterium RIFOXYA12_FULL_58_15]